MKYYTKKEASKLLVISIRTLDRQLRQAFDNLDKIVERDDQQKILIPEYAIKGLDKGSTNVEPLSNPKKTLEIPQKDPKKRLIELEKDKERLTKIVDDQREQLKEKDKIIEDSRQDFKILTSKIVEQNATILLLQQNTIKEEPKEEKQETANDTTINNDNKNSGSTALTWFLGFLIFFLGLALLIILLD